ncbi:hypothetical protein QAD02_002048, partial [Eretmocerus hayati]
MSTEKTPLQASAKPSFGSAQAIPFYVQDARRFYSRRRRERQLQCIMFVSIVATFIMALIITISYSVNHPEERSAIDQVEPLAPMASSSSPSSPLLLRSSGLGGIVIPTEQQQLTDKEMKLAVAAGNAALAARRLADSTTEPLPMPSPAMRHVKAVSTAPRADALALRGVAEIAATRGVEKARSFMGRPSSFGSFLDGGWQPQDVCIAIAGQGLNAALAQGDPLLAAGCPASASGERYRSYDGACNHPLQLGRAFTPFRRELAPDYADGIDAPRVGRLGNPLPSAREVSLKVHAPAPSSDPSFTVMLAVFGQFLDHDITATAISRGANGSSLTCCPPNGGTHPECFPVKIGPGDPVYDLTQTTCMEFVRSAPAAQCKIGPRQQLNQVSAFIDGSMVYGADATSALELRDLVGGRLRMQLTPDGRELLPASTDPDDGCNRALELARGRYCFASGDARANENLHLTTMHLLWARQHNQLAAKLAALNPEWDDERLYQEARRVVGAQLQHITYREFLPIVLGPSEVQVRGLGPATEEPLTLDDAAQADPSIANHFAAAAFRFAHTLLPGLMRMTDQQKGTSSYVQLHRMLFNPFNLYSEGGVESSITSATSNTIQRTSTHVSSQLTAHLFEDPLSNKSVPCGLDLVSLNIQRGRDHGLPGYTQWRQHCGLARPSNFADLSGEMDAEALDGISKLYADVDDVDLYTGALAELPKGDGLLGPTFTCLIARQFERLRMGDRYWYELANQPGSFSPDQLREIRKTSLARVICETSDNITQIQAQVMRSTGPDNPIVSCDDLPKVSLDPWKTEPPVLSPTDTEIKAQDWMSFKSEVNNSIFEIISNIMAMKPPPGSLPEDWLAFQKSLNSSFSDLGNKFAALNPKSVPTEAVASKLTTEVDDSNWLSVKNDVDRTVAEIMDSVWASKPPPGSPPSDWLAYRKRINDTIIGITDKFKLIHPVLEESADDVTADDAPIINWTKIKNQINATISDVVNSINASKPISGGLPGDWVSFKRKINDSFADIKNKFNNLWSKPTASPMESLSDATDDSTPFDWKAKYKKPKQPKPANPVLELTDIGTNPGPFDWLQFKDQLNGTLSEIITSIAASKPPPGSTPADWLKFQSQLNDTFNGFMGQFAALHPKPLLKLDGDPSSDPSDMEVAQSNANRTVEDVVAQINALRPPPGSPPEDWLIFRQKVAGIFAGTRKKYAFLYSAQPKTRAAMLRAASMTPMGPIDVVGFRQDLNKSLDDLVTQIKVRKPGVGSPVADWLAYKQAIRASVSQLKDKVAGFKVKELADNEAVERVPLGDPSFDWATWKSQINNTVDGILADIATIPAGDSVQWANFRKYLNQTFTDLKGDVASLKTNVVQSKLMAMMNQDWLNFKDSVNATIEDALDDIYTYKPPPGDPAWLNYGLYVKNRFAQMKEDVNALKADWLEKVKAVTEMMVVTDGDLPANTATSLRNTVFSPRQ